MSTQIVKVPDIGGAEDVEVIEICIAVGDRVEQEDSLVVLESDKASMEIPSPLSGKVVSINVTTGDTLSEGDVILEMEVEGAERNNTVVAIDVNKPSVETLQSVPAPQAVPEPVTQEPVEPAEPAEAAEPVASEVETIRIPDIGGADDAEVIEVCIIEGDEIEEGDSLVVLETDKASMEIPAPKSGVVASVAVKEGDKASEGSAILDLKVAGSTAAESTSTPTPTSTPAPATPAIPAQTSAVTTTVTATTTDFPAPAAEPESPPIQSSSSGAESPAPTQSAVVSSADDSAIPAPAFASLQVSGQARKTELEKPLMTPFYAGPAVRKLARELGVDLKEVKGSGPRGRIAKDDLKAYVKRSLQAKASSSSTTQGAGIPPVPTVDFAAFGDIKLEAMSKIQKITAANMQRNWLNIPHVTQFDDADITDLEDFRQSLKAQAQQQGAKITPLPFLLKSCAYVLKKHAKFNASLHSDGEHLVFKQYIHIGVAVDTPAGLVVPVIRDVDKKSIWQLAREAADLAERAKQRKLKPAEMQGGCFTISSLGGIGGQGFTPIVNAPEVAILGVSKLVVKPAWNGSEFVPRKMLPLALSYDHRAINGVDAGQFLTELVELLSDIRRLVL